MKRVRGREVRGEEEEVVSWFKVTGGAKTKSTDIFSTGPQWLPGNKEQRASPQKLDYELM